MGFVNVGCNYESMVAFRPTHCRFIAHLICFFRGDFSRLKGLAYLIGDDVILLLSAGDVLILPFRKKKFFIGSLGIRLIGADKLAVISFCGILRVVSAVSQTLSDCFPFVYMDWNFLSSLILSDAKLSQNFLRTPPNTRVIPPIGTAIAFWLNLWYFTNQVIAITFAQTTARPSSFPEIALAAFAWLVWSIHFLLHILTSNPQYFSEMSGNEKRALTHPLKGANKRSM